MFIYPSISELRFYGCCHLCCILIASNNSFSVKALGFKHTNMMEWFVMIPERMVLFKSAQNPDIYHRDYIAAPNGNREVRNLICPVLLMDHKLTLLKGHFFN